ncbi:hypothetical protein M9H77_36860 [Catharanthus roseus]|uniref:Uncharacterized protein n=1 Tax=Catharanthus roseus TaxID=4058 RepID=A0ACB9ZTE2_CATRO|nr:hypothetical protein M9H77_36860 [Catharanthus roseus]
MLRHREILGGSVVEVRELPSIKRNFGLKILRRHPGNPTLAFLANGGVRKAGKLSCWPTGTVKLKYLEGGAAVACINGRSPEWQQPDCIDGRNKRENGKIFMQ